ncbi:MAG: flagellar assembly protein FliW [Spirochaetales bacterium]|nr:flagellar assembly protein FliW [Leptospiraceae bacterium]MCP5482221.1 flagellar assembly protein FliW [Spirochaetales bacterium]MCP5484667.1 flagellar assembly protein FliW [Spirochaetales bacterium]
MPQLATRALGTVEINPAENIQFPDGLFGFSDVREFALLGERPDSPFKWLQSTARPDLAFIVIEPHLFLKEAYRPVLMRSDLEQLKVEKVEDCTIYLIVTIPRDHPEKMTANLQGPILVNTDERIGRQVISGDDAHVVRVSIMDQLEG